MNYYNDSGAESAKRYFEVLFLGTGAADWTIESRAGDRAYRRFASAMVNETILIDPGPDVCEAMRAFGVDASHISDILVTHSHSDHFSLQTLRHIADSKTAGSYIRLWADKTVCRLVPNDLPVQKHTVLPGKPFEIAGNTVTALPANHLTDCANETCLIFLFENGPSAWLYATDGAWLMQQTWYAIKGKLLDAVICDATVGEAEGDYRIFEHNSLPMVRQMRKAMLRNETLKPDGKFCLTHLARTLHLGHEELAAKLADEGMTVAYDGLKIMI